MNNLVYIVSTTNVRPGNINFKILYVFDNADAAKECQEELMNEGKQNVHVFVNKVEHYYMPEEDL